MANETTDFGKVLEDFESEKGVKPPGELMRAEPEEVPQRPDRLNLDTDEEMDFGVALQAGGDVSTLDRRDRGESRPSASSSSKQLEGETLLAGVDGWETAKSGTSRALGTDDRCGSRQPRRTTQNRPSRAVPPNITPDRSEVLRCRAASC